jgi:hypothetical protein
MRGRRQHMAASTAACSAHDEHRIAHFQVYVRERLRRAVGGARPQLSGVFPQYARVLQQVLARRPELKAGGADRGGRFEDSVGLRSV